MRPGRVGDQRVWLFLLEWEADQFVKARGTLVLGHYWVIAVDDDPPHKVVGEDSCA